MQKFNLGRVNQKAAAKSFVKSQRLLPLRRCDLGRLVYLWEKKSQDRYRPFRTFFYFWGLLPNRSSLSFEENSVSWHKQKQAGVSCF